jgi:hypothetical protein
MYLWCIRAGRIRLSNGSVLEPRGPSSSAPDCRSGVTEGLSHPVAARHTDLRRSARPLRPRHCVCDIPPHLLPRWRKLRWPSAPSMLPMFCRATPTDSWGHHRPQQPSGPQTLHTEHDIVGSEHRGAPRSAATLRHPTRRSDLRPASALASGALVSRTSTPAAGPCRGWYAGERFNNAGGVRSLTRVLWARRAALKQLPLFITHLCKPGSNSG